MKKILVIEDEYDVRSNLEELLQSEGFSVITAKDGAEGYTAAVINEPDLILSDISMPGMDGFELLKRIQDNPATSLIPFIFLTAKIEMRDVRKGMATGADDYIIKPFKADDVLDAINSRLKKNERYLSEIKEFKDVLMKRVPHELRTPLVGILGLSDIIHDEVDSLSKDELKEMAARIKKSGKRLHRRIEKFLTYTELLNQKKNYAGVNQVDKDYTIDPEFLKVNLMLKADEFGRRKDLNLLIGNDKLKMNPFFVETILMELVENSLKFSPKYTPIKVSCFINEADYIIEIRDKGAGSEKIIPHDIDIFNKFGLGGLTEEGLGVGLAIVKKIVDLSKGQLAFTRCDDENIMTVKLPLLKL